MNEVIYVMNPNDFSWRDTVYEGADNGLYRLYHRPVLASPFMIRKAIYRWHKSQSIPIKNEVLVSVPWYKWMFAGNRLRGFEILREMKSYADANGIKLTVMPLPAGCAYQNGGYALDAMHDDIDAFLSQIGVATVDARPAFASHAKEYCDATDHLTAEGNRATAAMLVERAAPTTHPASRP